MKEYLTRAGAEMLAASIRAYWAKQGKIVNLRIEEFRAPKDCADTKSRGPLYAIRSDMVAGLPRPI